MSVLAGEGAVQPATAGPMTNNARRSGARDADERERPFSPSLRTGALIARRAVGRPI